MVDAVLADAPGRVVVDGERVELDVASRVVLAEFVLSVGVAKRARVVVEGRAVAGLRS